MLIPFSFIFNKYKLKVTGLCHVGAHFAQEHKDYLREGVTKVAYIEASPTTYYTLCRLSLPGQVSLFNVALADYEGSCEMYMETANQGQSSSLLKPGTHTAHYPSIVFDKRESVKVTTLDNLKLTGYNMLNIDVQGAELLVLKGGLNTLVNIDYVYTEVNREAVYEGCALIGEMDELLTGEGFERVETSWTGQGWGDAFYIRTGGRSIEKVPETYQTKMPFPYPKDNHVEFERWFFLNTKSSEIKGRVYLPIFWTGFYVTHKYGKDRPVNSHLQAYINKLDRSKKYFTIVQYDDGILHDVSHLDIKIFSMGGGRIDYPLPLICQPHKPLPPVKKDIFCSFVGNITHHIRKTLIDQLTGKDGYYISTKNHTPEKFAEILNRSKFVLSPRGYGKTSFRIQEALQYGATPVEVTDSHIPIHNLTETPWLIKCSSPLEVVGRMKDFEQTVDPYEIYDKYFTYEANKKLILENL